MGISAFGDNTFVLSQCFETGVFTLVEHIADGLTRGKFRVLFEVAKLDAFAVADGAGICDGRVHQGAHERAFPGAVLGDNGNFLPFRNPESQVGEQRFNPIGFTELVNGKKVFNVQLFHRDFSDPLGNGQQISFCHKGHGGHRRIIWPIFGLWHLHEVDHFFRGIAACGDVLERGTDEFFI